MGFASRVGECGESWECGWPEEAWRKARSKRAVVNRDKSISSGRFWLDMDI